MVLHIDLHTGEFPSRISTPFRTLIWLRSTSSRPQPKPLWCDIIVFMPFDPGGDLSLIILHWLLLPDILWVGW